MKSITKKLRNIITQLSAFVKLKVSELKKIITEDGIGRHTDN